MRISMKALGADQRTHIVITQHVLVVMNLTFTIYVGITQCANVSMKAFGADQCTYVVITKHIQVD